MEVTFANVLRGQNVKGKVILSYLVVRKEIANFCLQRRKTVRLIYLKVKD